MSMSHKIWNSFVAFCVLENMLDRRSLVQAPNAPRDQSQHPRARNDYDEETACESYMNPEPGFQPGAGGSLDAD